MRDRIMFVDDDRNILASFKRQFTKHFDVSIAENGRDALFFIETEAPFAVIISDYRMPVMDGIAFFQIVKEKAPDTIRILLTGNADLQIAMKAVNEGNIFRFLTKDSPPKYLINGLLEGIKQYRLQKAERELLEETLKGSIQVLTELLSMANPEAFGRATRIKPLVVKIARHLNLENLWQVETAAMLSHIGYLILNPETIAKHFRGEKLTASEQKAYASHPGIAAELLGRIPRMEAITEIIACQNAPFESGTARRNGDEIPLAARILKAVRDYEHHAATGQSPEHALETLTSATGQYDPAVMDALRSVLDLRGDQEGRLLKVDALEAGMILNQDIITVNGTLLMPCGKEISDPILRRLRLFVEQEQITEPIRVLHPQEDRDATGEIHGNTG